MAQARDNEQPATSAGGASRAKPLPVAWLLFTAVWLLFPIGFIVQVLRTDLTPVQTLAFLVSMAAFIAVFVWLMLLYPFRADELPPPERRIRDLLLAALAVLALYAELVYGSGVPYRFMYVIVAAAVTLSARKAVWTVVAVTVFVGVFYVVRSGWDVVAAGWGFLIPFPLIGVGMIAMSRLVVTIRELRAAREEIARLAVSEERLRFARDLHDLLGHSLSLITLKSELAGRLLPDSPEKAASEVRDIEGVARKALGEVREAVAGYRQPTLATELAGAKEMLEAAGMECHVEDASDPLPSAIDSALAWTVREGVTNVIRHSNAGRCEVRISRSSGSAAAEVTDDGGGPATNVEKSGGSGLSGLSERISALGGDFEAGSLPNGGFGLRVCLPLGARPERSYSEISAGYER